MIRVESSPRWVEVVDMGTDTRPDLWKMRLGEGEAYFLYILADRAQIQDHLEDWLPEQDWGWLWKS